MMRVRAKRITLLLLIALLVPLPSYAQTSWSIALPWGRVSTTNNEVNIDSTVDDPSGLRLGSPRGGGKLSGDIVEAASPDHREEIAILQFKQDERVRALSHTDPRSRTGCVTLHLRQGTPEVLGGDGDMIKVLEICTDYLWTPWTGMLTAR